MYRFFAALVCIVIAGGTGTVADAADAADGRKKFEKNCEKCQSIRKGNNTYGPSLYCVVGRKALTTKFKHYAPDFRAAVKGIVWTEAILFAYLADSEGFVGKRIGKKTVITNMDMKWPDAALRGSVIAFLKSSCR